MLFKNLTEIYQILFTFTVRYDFIQIHPTLQDRPVNLLFNILIQ